MKILLVCLGNICRSPAAEATLRRLARHNKLSWRVESCAVGPWNIGKPAHPPMVDAAHSSGLDLSNHQARMIKSTDFLEFDFIVAMDRDIHLRLQDMRPQNYKAKIVPYQGSSLEEMVDVPDPYYTEDFAGVMKQIIDGASGLVNRIL